ESSRVRLVARPTIVARVRHHLGLNRVQLNVPITAERMSLRADDPGVKASFPEGAAASKAFIDSLYVVLACMSHHLRARLRRTRRDKQMHVIGHQAVSVNRASEAH